MCCWWFVCRQLIVQGCLLICLLLSVAGYSSARAQETSSTQPIAAVKTNANLRAEPSMRGQILRVVPAGTVIEVFGRTGSWERVRIDKTQHGWIYASLLVRLQQPVAFQAAVTPLPTDTPAADGHTEPAEQTQQQPDQQNTVIATPSPRPPARSVFPRPDPASNPSSAKTSPAPTSTAPPAVESAVFSTPDPLPAAPAPPTEAAEPLIFPASKPPVDTASAAVQPAEALIFPTPDPPLAAGQTAVQAPEPLIFPDRSPPVRSATELEAEAGGQHSFGSVGDLLGDNVWLVVFVLAVFLGLLLLLVYQIRRNREIKQRIYVFEQNNRYPTLTWQPAEDLKPFLPRGHNPDGQREGEGQYEQAEPAEQVEIAGIDEQDERDQPDETEAFLRAAEGALSGEDAFEQTEHTAQYESQDWSDQKEREEAQEGLEATAPSEPHIGQAREAAAEMAREGAEQGKPAWFGADGVPQAPTLPPGDRLTQFTPAERAVLEAISSQASQSVQTDQSDESGQAQVLEHELKDMLDQRGFQGVLVKGVVGDIMRKTGRDGRPCIRVHYAAGSYSYQLQYLPGHSPEPGNGLDVSPSLNGHHEREL